MPNQNVTYAIDDRLYLNITDRCTLECKFCPKHNGSWTVHDYDLALQRRPSVADVLVSIGEPQRYSEVVFCGYGEPTLRLEPLVQIAEYVQAHRVPVRVNTDGLANLVHKRNVLPLFQGRINALSVSLNAQNEAVYERHCQPTLPGSFDAVKAFLKQAKEYVPAVTATAIDGLEGVDIDACRALATELGVDFRRRELDVVG